MKTMIAVLAIAFVYSTALNYEQDKQIQKLQRFVAACAGENLHESSGTLGPEGKQ